MGKEQSTFIKFLDAAFVAGGEMIADNGEDSSCCALADDIGLVAVFDGCGGIGSRKYPEYGNKTGAYIASRCAAQTVRAWFNDFSSAGTELSGNTLNSICKDIKERITAGLKAYEGGAGTSSIKGSMTKSFPTTASIILFTSKERRLYTSYIWAGDSRGFILNSSGLSQITADDIEEEADAMSNLSSDSPLSNFICADGNYSLHSEIITSKGPAVLITATDGCFGYFYTPMEFEYMLLDTLSKAKSIDGWERRIDEYIKKYTSDDYTIGIAVYGYRSFKKLKSAFAVRQDDLYKKYISRLGKAAEKEKKAFWEEYKTKYYRGVK